MKFLHAALVLAATAGLAGKAQAQIVNVDGTSSVGTTVNLAAGTYDVTFAGLAGGGQYDGYSLSTDNGAPSRFTDELSISLGGQTNFNTAATYNLLSGGVQQNFGSAAQALAAYQTALAAGQLSYSAGYTNQAFNTLVNEITFTLTAPGQVTFTAPDIQYWDNSGGLSLLLTQLDVPEPASIALMATGLVALTLVLRRRSTGVQRSSEIRPAS